MNTKLKISYQVNNPEITFPSDDKNVSQVLRLNDTDITIARLQDPSEIKQILHLRQQIDLTAAVAADPLFWDHEKKEMR